MPETASWPIPLAMPATAEAKEGVFLILDKLRGHHAKPLKAWLWERTDDEHGPVSMLLDSSSLMPDSIN